MSTTVQIKVTYLQQKVTEQRDAFIAAHDEKVAAATAAQLAAKDVVRQAIEKSGFDYDGKTITVTVTPELAKQMPEPWVDDPGAPNTTRFDYLLSLLEGTSDDTIAVNVGGDSTWGDILGASF